jgi:hypothetical protein
MTLAMAVILPLSLLIYSNSRITDTKETLRAEIGTLRIEMQKEALQIRADFSERFNFLERKFDDRFNSIDRKLDELLRLVADHDSRIRNLEERPR